MAAHPLASIFVTPVLETLLLLYLARLSLWLLPFRTARSLVGALGRGQSRTEAPRQPEVDRLVRGLGAASRLVPRATCLTRAMALQALLARRGIASTVGIGVAKDDGGGLQAHAWVEIDGKVVLGGSELRHFTPIHYLVGKPC